MVEYGLLVSKSSEILFSAFGQLQRFFYVIPYGRAIAIGVIIALFAYWLLRPSS